MITCTLRFNSVYHISGETSMIAPCDRPVSVNVNTLARGRHTRTKLIKLHLSILFLYIWQPTKLSKFLLYLYSNFIGKLMYRGFDISQLFETPVCRGSAIDGFISHVWL